MYHEIKSLVKNDTVFYSLVIVVVAVLSFGLGRLSVAETATLKGVAPLVPLIEEAPAVVPEVALPTSSVVEVGEGQAASLSTEAGVVVASKSGTKYHFPWCPGAKQIKEANRITFDTAMAARARGYTPAANCPGLE